MPTVFTSTVFAQLQGLQRVFDSPFLNLALGRKMSLPVVGETEAQRNIKKFIHS